MGMVMACWYKGRGKITQNRMEEIEEWKGKFVDERPWGVDRNNNSWKKMSSRCSGRGENMEDSRDARDNGERTLGMSSSWTDMSLFLGNS